MVILIPLCAICFTCKKLRTFSTLGVSRKFMGNDDSPNHLLISQAIKELVEDLSQLESRPWPMADVALDGQWVRDVIQRGWVKTPMISIGTPWMQRWFFFEKSVSPVERWVKWRLTGNPWEWYELPSLLQCVQWDTSRYFLKLRWVTSKGSVKIPRLSFIKH